MGIRVYSPNDWIVRIKKHDGSVRLVGVQPNVHQDAAAFAALRHAMIPEAEIADVDVLRRREAMKVQV
tara:strand:+ start:211 stop:414 length:204 start_codon:yes stop_codon:yes gene_type:complete